MIQILLLFILLSTTFTIGKAALFYISPILFIGFRMSIAGILLLGYIYLFRRRQWYLNKNDWLLLTVISFFHIYISFILEFWGLQYLPSAKVCFLFNLTPFMTAFLEWIYFGARMTVKKWLGLLIGFFGFFPVLLAEATEELSIGSFFFLSFPELAILISATTAAYAWVLIKKLMDRDHYYTPFMINGIAMFSSGIAAIITSLSLEKRPLLKLPSYAMEKLGVHLTWLKSIFGTLGLKLLPLIGYTSLLILIANIIFYNFYAHLLKKYSATFMSFVGFTSPLFAAFFGWVFLGETISRSFFVSVFVVGLGLYIFYRAELDTNKNM